MSAISQIVASFVTPVVAPAYVGATPYESLGGSTKVVNYPAGTTAGDLVIVAQHDFAPFVTPTGFTLAFTTAADSNGYQFRVSYKIAAGETSVTIPSGQLTGFDSAVVVMRGCTSVSASHTFNAASGGAANSITAAGVASTILIASDRGASASYPTVSSTARTATFSFAALYFKQTSGVYVSRAAGTTISYTDVVDTEQTTGMFITVLP